MYRLQGNGSGVDSHNPYEATLAARRELHRPGSERSCLHAELDLGGSQVSSIARQTLLTSCCDSECVPWRLHAWRSSAAAQVAKPCLRRSAS